MLTHSATLEPLRTVRSAPGTRQLEGQVDRASQAVQALTAMTETAAAIRIKPHGPASWAVRLRAIDLVFAGYPDSLLITRSAAASAGTRFDPLA